MTHAELVQVAADWLRRRHRCVVVLTEPKSQACHSSPDAIGWTYRGSSVHVEVKVSVRDFKADQKKTRCRVPDLCMGEERFYLTPPGLISLVDMPPGWGLAEWDGRVVRVRRKAKFRPLPDMAAHEERVLLISAYRQVTEFAKEKP